MWCYKEVFLGWETEPLSQNVCHAVYKVGFFVSHPMKENTNGRWNPWHVIVWDGHSDPSATRPIPWHLDINCSSSQCLATISEPQNETVLLSFLQFRNWTRQVTDMHNISIVSDMELDLWPLSETHSKSDLFLATKWLRDRSGPYSEYNIFCHVKRGPWQSD